MTNKTNMKPYFHLMKDILENGTEIINERTGEKCWYLTSTRLVFNASEGFHANTRKKVGIKGPKGELLAFFNGVTDAKIFDEVYGTSVWYSNANETKAWLENPWRKGENDNGLIYGFKDWVDNCIVQNKTERDFYIAQGYKVAMEGKDGGFTMTRTINQFDKLIYGILTNPSSRSHLVTANNIARFDRCSLPPCHHTYTFTCNPDGTIDIECAMRSWDMALAYNLQITEIFLHLVARLVSKRPNKIVINSTNTHLYESGIEGVKTMLSRDDYPAPTLVLSDNIKPVDLSNYEGALARVRPEDITLEGYQSHEAIKTKMAA